MIFVHKFPKGVCGCVPLILPGLSATVDAVCKVSCVQVRELANANDLKMHLDGARVMNAATALQVPPSHITKHFDSISMCFSKVSGFICDFQK